MTPRDRARREAMAFIAAYDRPDAGDDERRVARIARIWLSLLGMRQSVQGLVDTVVEELFHSHHRDGGCGWEDLQRKFARWAVAEEWLDPDDRRLHGDGSV